MAMVAASFSPSHADYSADTSTAWCLGYAMGLETEVSEPPPGFTPAERAAFRRGWALAESGRERPSEVASEADPVLTDEDLTFLYGDDHDGQFCPLDIEYWALSEFEYYDAERELEEMWHDAEIERVLGHRFAERGGEE